MNTNSFAAGENPLERNLNSLRILLVDDNKVNQFLGKRLLQNMGIAEVSLATGAHEALSILREKPIDLVLTDIEMPEMNGLALCRYIRNHPNEIHSSGIRMIALSGNSSKGDRTIAKQAGIDDFIGKPYNAEELQEVLRRNLPAAEYFIMEESSDTAEETSLPGMLDLFTHLGFNKADIVEYLKEISQRLPLQLHDIKKGMVYDDWNRSLQAMLGLKDTLRFLVPSEIHQALDDLTEDLLAGRSLEKIPSIFEELSPLLDSLIVLIHSEIESLTEV